MTRELDFSKKQKDFFEILPPPSKSISHRLFILAALSKGKSIIKNIAYSDDILATLSALDMLGVNIKKKKDSVIIDGNMDFSKTNILNLRESGTSLRFFLALKLCSNSSICFKTKGSLKKRSVNAFMKFLDDNQKEYSLVDDLYLKFSAKLESGNYSIIASESSQYLSGLAFHLSRYKEKSVVNFIGNLESRPYLELSLEMLKKHNIYSKLTDNRFEIIGGDIKAFEETVEADYSNLAFWIVIGLFNNGCRIKNLNKSSYQADRVFLDILKSIGGEISFDNSDLVVSKSKLEPFDVEITNSPDIAPMLAVLAASIKGTSYIRGSKRLKDKESDRESAIVDILNKLGAKCSVYDNFIKINGIEEKFNSIKSTSFNDHRIVQLLAAAASRATGSVSILKSGAINKSYPDFFEKLSKIWN